MANEAVRRLSRSLCPHAYVRARTESLAFGPGAILVSPDIHGSRLVRDITQGAVMITLGILLLIVGFIAKIAILWTIGIVLVVIGLALVVLGSMGRAVGGRRHYY
jgi:hypothetical protein